jgi:hypothetical protein
VGQIEAHERTVGQIEAGSLGNEAFTIDNSHGISPIDAAGLPPSHHDCRWARRRGASGRRGANLTKATHGTGWRSDPLDDPFSHLGTFSARRSRLTGTARISVSD